MFISFGYLTKKSILFLALPIAMIIRITLFYFTFEIKTKNIFYGSFLHLLGRSINGILWLLFERKVASKKLKKIDNKNTELVTTDQNILQKDNENKEYTDELKRESIIYSQYESDFYEKRKIEEKRNLKKLCLLILICFLDFVFIVYFEIIVKVGVYSIASGLQSLSLVIRLFAIAILSKLIIKNTKIYSHHFLSIIIIVMVVIIINIFSIVKEKKDFDFLKFGLIDLAQILYSIIYVCGEKYLSITKGNNVYKLLFIDGIIGMILLISLQIFVYFFISCDSLNGFFYEMSCDTMHKNFQGMVESFDFKEIVNSYKFSIPLVLINFCEILFIWLLIFNFSANHLGAICSIQLFGLCVIFKHLEAVHYLVYILGSLIITFMTLVYNEIIIIKFCGFDKNTAIEIDKRSQRDSSCDFEIDEDEIYVKSNDNYIIMKEDIEELNDYNN